jgi:Fur family ferric uptake transcriptional regulator
VGVVRKTKSVKAVLHKFEEQEDAITAVELVEKLSDKMNKTTVYRILERLEQDGVLHSFAGKDGVRWYAKCSNCGPANHVDTHPHFQCMACGKTECIDADISNVSGDRIPSIPNYSIESVQVLFVGKCVKCLA